MGKERKHTGCAAEELHLMSQISNLQRRRRDTKRLRAIVDLIDSGTQNIESERMYNEIKAGIFRYGSTIKLISITADLMETIQ